MGFMLLGPVDPYYTKSQPALMAIDAGDAVLLGTRVSISAAMTTLNWQQAHIRVSHITYHACLQSPEIACGK